ncbi:DMT family transporter [Motiliproteus sp. MSK22-1]|uniref:DMT family transporter n=1 Tax=Motiliproteus sp. MSK22-1 TaxID=1897630 RepID=UPI003515E05F
MVLVTFIAASGWIFSKETLDGMPPWLFIGIRFSLAGIVLLFAGYRYWSLLSSVTNIKHCVQLGLVMAVAMLFWILGLHHGTHMGEGAFITSLGAVMVPLVGRLFFGERPPLSTWSAIPLAVAGLACLSLEGGFQFEIGQIYFLSAAVLFAVHFSLVSRAAVSMPAIMLTAVQLIVVGIVSLTVSAFMEEWPSSFSTSIWGWLLASALIATSLRFFLQTYGQGLTPASHAALIMVLEPIWTAILALIWFGERMQGLQALGCFLIFAALLISRWRWIQKLVRAMGTKG